MVLEPRPREKKEKIARKGSKARINGLYGIDGFLRGVLKARINGLYETDGFLRGVLKA